MTLPKHLRPTPGKAGIYTSGLEETLMALHNVNQYGARIMADEIHHVGEKGLKIIQSELAKRNHKGKKPRSRTRPVHLYDSYTLGNKMNIYTETSNAVVIGSEVFYADFVNSGHFQVPPGGRRKYRYAKKKNTHWKKYKWVKGSHYYDAAETKIHDLAFTQLDKKYYAMYKNAFRHKRAQTYSKQGSTLI